MQDSSQRINAIIAQYLLAVEQGRDVDRDELLQGQSALEPALRSFFLNYDRMQNVGQQVELPCFEAGTLLSRYRLERTIGSGAFGEVWLATDMELKRLVAVKVPRCSRFLNPLQAELFLSEARTMAALHAQGIVPVYDVGRCDSTTVFLVSRYIEGSDLAALLKDQDPWTPQDAIRLTVTVARALDAAHAAGIIHRDIKPSNILLESGTNDAWVTDFGLAVSTDNALDSGMLVGTPAYMSPEQIRCDPSGLDARSDVFSLGVVLYQMLTGRKPFQGETMEAVMQSVLQHTPVPPCRINDSVPDWLSEACIRALEKEPRDRFPSASSFADELAERSDFRHDRLQRPGVAKIPENDDSPAEHGKPSCESASAATPIKLITNQRPSSRAWLLAAAAIFGVVIIRLPQWLQPDDVPLESPVAVDAVKAVHHPRNTAGVAVSNASAAQMAAEEEQDFDRQMANTILQLGGTVDVKFGSESREFASIEELPSGPLQLQWVMMPRNPLATDALLLQLRSLKHLEGIDFYATSITDQGIVHLGEIPSITHVYLHQTGLSDRGATAIASLPRLDRLVMANTKITDATLHRLAGNRTLRWLDVSGTQVTDAGLTSIAQIPFLIRIDLAETLVTDNGLQSLAELRHVQELDVENTDISLDGLRALSHWSLRHLHLSADRFPEGFADTIADWFPDCHLRLD